MHYLREHVLLIFSYPGTQIQTNDPSVLRHSEFLSSSHKSIVFRAACKHSSISALFVNVVINKSSRYSILVRDPPPGDTIKAD